ncbi:methanogenesis marker 3 protein [Methanobrevibacter sp. DSM 116169]|uniref:methyl-coenzyme M reductase-associated protein Mmp3 n=1 Tax=Methanobrevibacter sp. DSM 116169 TaxID=3242727 RepID=UPI0038FC2B9C
MLVEINGKEFDLKEGSTIKEAIDISNSYYVPGTVICLIKGEKEFEKNIDKYKIKTNKGSIIIQMVDEANAKPLVDIWKEKYKDLINLNVRWSTSNEIAIGPITTDLEPTKEKNKYLDNDVLISLSSFSNESTHIIFIKDNVTNVYATPHYNNGVFAKVIGGRKTVDLLTDDDLITDIEPIVERNTVVDSSAISDLSTILNEGNKLFTYVSIDVNEKSPECVEHLFSLIDNGKLKIDYDSNSFIGFNELEGINKPGEDITSRTRGTVTVRNTGKGVGKLYIYRESRILAPSHTNVGKIIEGMALIDIAKKGDIISVKSKQKRIMTLGSTQAEVSKLLKSLGIEHIREGITDDDAVIVEQDPFYTINILDKKKIKTKAIVKDELAILDLSNNAPRTNWYFKKLTGLVENPVGKLTVHFSVPGMNLFMFKGDTKSSKGLIPENSPVTCIEANTIGITNMSRKNTGLIGVRLEDSEEFGPTGEPFKGTNIVGKFTSGFEHIKEIKEGDVLYVRESLHES